MSNIISTLHPAYAARLKLRRQSQFQSVWDSLDKVFDPELPGLTIWDLGVLQNVKFEDQHWLIDVTPTYSGCPAVEAINQDIVSVLTDAGFSPVKINLVLSPAWSTDMISPQGKAHLKSIHIAPPSEQETVQCPVCESEQTELISQFGSTACKSLYHCKSCFESFDYFKHF